jgi:hypothetical protein
MRIRQEVQEVLRGGDDALIGCECKVGLGNANVRTTFATYLLAAFPKHDR